jgi:integrase
VDLAAGWLRITDAKTDAGVRKVKIRGALRDELTGLSARRADPGGYVFPTREGGQQDTHNIRARVVAAAIERANTNLAAAELPPLPEQITPHSLRRTFCSLLYALGEDPGTVMDEMGHTDPGLALRLYRQAMRREDGEKAALQALVEGSQLAVIGIRDPEGADEAEARRAA